MRLLSYVTDGLQLLFRVYEAFVSSGNVVVDLDAEHVALLGIADYLVRAVVAQPVSPNADVVSPILSGGKFLGEAEFCQQDEKRERQDNARAGSDTRRGTHR